MKKSITAKLHILPATILFCVVLLIAGCVKRGADGGPFRWPQLTPEVDSLSQRIDKMFFLQSSEEDISKAIDSLERAVGTTGAENKEVAELRKIFYETRLHLYKGDEEEYQRGISYLLSNVDSSSNPYLYNRVLSIVPESDTRNVEEYERLTSLLEFYRNKKDEIMMANTLIDLGNLMKNVRDPRPALQLYEEADSLLRRNGMEKLASFNRINIASVHIILRDTVKGVRILEGMIKDSLIRNNPDLAEIVYHNLYIEGGKRYALDSLYALKGEESESLIETFLSNAMLNEGDIKGALTHARMAVEKALEDDNENDYAVALYNQADALSASGDTLKAYRSLIKAVELTDEIANANEPEMIKDAESDRMISMYRLEKELAKSRWQLRLVCIGFGLLIVMGIAGYLLWKRIAKLRLRNRIANEEKEKIQRKLVATQIAMEETNNVLTTVGKAVDEMSDSVRLPAQSREIVNAIHTHKVRSGERETFIDSFTEVNPDFARRLKEINKAITEPDVRLASYIVTGMDNKKIAATMGIRPESVKQARWRLRTKLSLPKGASLEEALRELNSR